jgi:hypothetical protein
VESSSDIVTPTVYLTLTMTKGEKIPMSTAEVPDVYMDEKLQFFGAYPISLTIAISVLKVIYVGST